MKKFSSIKNCPKNSPSHRQSHMSEVIGFFVRQRRLFQIDLLIFQQKFEKRSIIFSVMLFERERALKIIMLFTLLLTCGKKTANRTVRLWPWYYSTHIWAFSLAFSLAFYGCRNVLQMIIPYSPFLRCFSSIFIGCSPLL